MPGPPSARAKFYFQILSTPTADTPGTTLLLHFDNQRYLFGSIAEGTQRLCVQRGIGLKKVKSLFITGRSTWRDIGGLIGMILTMADVQASAAASSTEPLEKPRLAIHGGPLLTHSVACGRRFVFRTGMPVSIDEFEHVEGKSVVDPTWKDENIRVWAVPAYSSRHVSSTESETPDSESEVLSDASSSSHSRKRSHDDFMENSPRKPKFRLDPRDQEVRRSVVSDMFESGWRYDNLIETTWAEVQKPAVMFIRDPETHQLLLFNPPLEASVPSDQKVLVRKPWPAALVGNLPAPPKNFPRPAMSYIVRGYPQRGVFDPKKAKELGVPKGPMYKQLTDGHTLELESGTVVKPDMVLGPTKPGRGMAIIDLPSRDFVQGLLDRPEWTSEHVMTGIEAMCWILGRDVAGDPRLQSFMASRPGIKHIVSSVSTCPNYLAMDSSAASAIRLSRISRDNFPIPVHDNRTTPQVHPLGLAIDTAVIRPGTQAAERGLKIQVEPKFEIQQDEVAPWLDAVQAIKNTPEGVPRLAADAREEIARAKSISNGPKTNEDLEPEVIALGTGSALPSKYRNVSATLLRIPGKGSYLFDCGENTIGQLARVFGSEQLTNVLLDLKMIWISHLHADHHLGTMGVLTAWNEARAKLSAEQRAEKKLFIASEVNMMYFLQDYLPLSSIEQKGVVQLVCNPFADIKVQSRRIADGPFGLAKRDLHIDKLQTSSVKHCWGAQAVSVTFDNGFKFSYSGDCRPSSYFAHIGRNSDVLVHEATFEDGMEGDAVAKKHSTTGEALAVASLMKAKNLILTHFSQRYQKIPVMGNVRSPEQVNFEDGTVMAGAPEGPVDNAMDLDVTGLADDKPKNDIAGSMPNPSNEATSQQYETWLKQNAGEASWNPETTEQSRSGGTDDAASKAQLPDNISPSNQLNSHDDINVCVAFDYMRVRVSDIKHMHRFTPALTALFEAEHPEIIGTEATEPEKVAIMNGRGPKKAGTGDYDKYAGTPKTAPKSNEAKDSETHDVVKEAAVPKNTQEKDVRKNNDREESAESSRNESGSGSNEAKSKRQGKRDAKWTLRREKKRVASDKQKQQDQRGKARREKSGQQTEGNRADMLPKI